MKLPALLCALALSLPASAYDALDVFIAVILPIAAQQCTEPLPSEPVLLTPADGAEVEVSYVLRWRDSGPVPYRVTIADDLGERYINGDASTCFEDDPTFGDFCVLVDPFPLFLLKGLATWSVEATSCAGSASSESTFVPL